MKVAIIGSRNLKIEHLEDYLPQDVTELVSGGAKGIDTCVKHYALNNNIPLTEFFPNYDRYKKAAPLKRNLEIIEYADMVIAFWDGSSHGTRFVIDSCRKQGKPLELHLLEPLHD